MPSIKKLSATPSLVALVSLVAVPAQAAELPRPAAPSASFATAAWAPGADSAAAHRRYRRNRGVDAGDVLAGILILGGIAAVASATKGARDSYPRDMRYPDPRRGDYRYDDGRGIDRAVSMCVDAIERDARVETVDAVTRNAEGWNVSGSLYDGQGFTCSIGETGRIEAIDYGQGTEVYRGADTGYGTEEDRQYGDDAYAAARARADDAEPAYPGGPLPGEEQGEVDADLEIGTGYQGRSI